MISAALMLFANTLLFSLRLDRSGSFPRPLSASEERMWLERLAQGDPEARNVLIERNLRLVAHIVKKYYAQSSDQDDLISIGTIGLIKGVNTFNIESDREGNALQLMDVIGVDDTMLEDLYDRDSALRLRRLVKECLTQRESEVIRLRYGLGGTVPLTQREIASTFGISRSYVSRIEKRALEKLRAELEKPVGSGAGQ